MESAMIDTIFFDLDDTLLDFSRIEPIALKKALGEFGVAADGDMAKRYHDINISKWKALERGELKRCEVIVSRFEQLFDEYGICADPSAVQKRFEWLVGEEYFFMPGAKELLLKLYGKYRIYIVTNGTGSVQHRRLEASGIDRLINGVFISEELGAEKPRRAFFDSVFVRIGKYDADRIIIVGDSLSSDIAGGINAGIHTCLYDPSGISAKDRIIPEYRIGRLSELEKLLVAI